jgi:hypothetical protein
MIPDQAMGVEGLILLLSNIPGELQIEMDGFG